MKPTFKNKQNTAHKLKSGETIFNSRSVAVAAIVCGWDEKSKNWHVVLGKRGAAVDQSGKWGYVCGYLDWDETLLEAVKREVWEEAGIDLTALEIKEDANICEQPFFVQSTMDDARQNVTCRYFVQINHLTPLTVENAEKNEISETRWVPLLKKELIKFDFAFNHKAILDDIADWLEDDETQDEFTIDDYIRFKKNF